MYFQIIEKNKFVDDVCSSIADETLEVAAGIIADVRARGYRAVLDCALKYKDLCENDKVIYSREDLKYLAAQLPQEKQDLLKRVARRIESFALEQKNALTQFSLSANGFTYGQKIIPIKRAACYAPGGRYPLPSSVLMTAVTARAAGVEYVVVASPKPTLETFAAAYFAGAEQFVALGGAQVIAAFAYGASPIEKCDIVVGPGNKYVTAAKQLVCGVIGIDMLAGPSELLVVVDETSDLKLVAADLLAQAEHDADARPLVISLDRKIPELLEAEITKQLNVLSTAETAKHALKNSKLILVETMEEAIEISDRIAPEHLEIMTRDADLEWHKFSSYGAIFVGASACEVFGDYGIGPNHVLPTAAAAKFSSGLSVYNFLKTRTFITEDKSNISGRDVIIEDTAKMAELEGLVGHRQAAMVRRTGR
ncbi:MAG: histidinol dehydrogenase [Proteobacteria bacterium]|nr:histidinol dehydrogenase [Pseudomonadota bacterium]